jgi:hypothetical protein
MEFALLRLLLNHQGLEFSFEQLKEIVKSGYVSIGDYLYPENKSFRIQRTLNLNATLETIFKVFKLNFDYFDIKLLPTNENKN